jgi:hypothetical protein
VETGFRCSALSSRLLLPKNAVYFRYQPVIDLAHDHDPDLATFSHHHFEDITWSDPDKRVRAVQSLFDEKGALRLAEDVCAQRADVEAQLAEVLYLIVKECRNPHL